MAPAPAATGERAPRSRVAPRLRRAWSLSTALGVLGAVAGLILVARGVQEQRAQPGGLGGFDVFGGVVIVAVTVPSALLFLAASRWHDRHPTAAHVLAGVGAAIGLLAWGTAAVDLGAALTRSGAPGLSAPLFTILAMGALWHLAVLVWGIAGEYTGRRGADAPRP